MPRFRIAFNIRAEYEADADSVEAATTIARQMFAEAIAEAPTNAYTVYDDGTVEEAN